MPATRTERKSRAPRRGRVPRRWVKNASDELAIRRGCTFDESYPERVAEFFRRFLRHTKDTPYTRAGDPFELLPWQYEDVIGPLFGWRRPDGRRRFTELYCQLGKKNGKSALGSGLALEGLVVDDVAVPEIYVLGVDRASAGSIFDECERMVEVSPEIKGRLRVIPSRKTIVYPTRFGSLRAESKEVANKEGRGPSRLIFDELHLHRDASMWRIFRYAMRARPEPLTCVFTTAGTAEDVTRKSICFRRYDYAKRVAAGEIEDLRVLGVIYEAEPDDPVDSEETWRKANPSLGVTLRAEDFADDLIEAKHDPEAMTEFMQKRLNIWVASRDRFIDADDWNACRGELPPAALLARNAGREFHGGLDLASTIDIAAFAALFPQPDGTLDLHVKLWCPEATIEKRSRRDGVNYDVWSREGWIEATPGKRVSQKLIKQYIKTFCKDHRCRSLDADPWNAAKILEELTEEEGIPAHELGQGYSYLNAPTKELQGLILDRRIRHGGNPVLDWMAGNLRVRSDGLGNIRPDRKRSAEKIDGLAATVFALFGWLDAGRAAAAQVSGYARDRGMVVSWR